MATSWISRTTRGTTDNDDIVGYLHQIPSFVDMLDRHQYSCDNNLAEQFAYRGEDHLQLLLTLCHRAEQLSFSDLHEDLWELFSLVRRKLTRFCNLVEGFLSEGDPALARATTLSTTVSIVRRGTPGRPSFFISQTQLEALMELGFSYSKIARMLCISERTLQRRRAELGLPVGRSMLYSSISDEQLDEVVSSIMQVICTYIIIQ